MATPNVQQNKISKALQWLAHELGLHTMRHAGRDIYIIILTRSLRMYAYGSVALVLALYLQAQGLSDAAMGLFMTLTLLGDVFVSLLLTLVADALGRRTTLLLGALGMAGSGAVFATSASYPWLLAAAVVGVISPSGNEIGPFRAVEESTLASLVGEQGRADVYTWYVAFAVLGTSTGLIIGGHVVDALSAKHDWTHLDAYRAVFWMYTAVGLLKAASTLFLSAACEHGPRTQTDETAPLLSGVDNNNNSNNTTQSPVNSNPPDPERKKRSCTPLTPLPLLLLKLTALFSLDALGSGMIPFSLINYYMTRTFRLDFPSLGWTMSGTWLLSFAGSLLSAPLSRRLGLVPAMLVSHLPAAILLAALPLATGSLPAAIVLLAGRALLASVDQAPRAVLLSALVLPEERTAVMGVVNTGKILSQSGGPWVTGLLAGEGRFWVAFVVAGGLKAAYDVLLVGMFGWRVGARNAVADTDTDTDAEGSDE